MNIKYQKKCFPERLEQEISSIGEEFRILYLDESVEITFPHLLKFDKSIENSEEVVTTYKKAYIEYVQSDNGLEKIATEEDYTFDINKLNQIIENHNYNDGLYANLTKKYIKEKYSQDQETGLTNDCIQALMANQPSPQEYLDYRTYVEECKNKAYLEVYGIERG